MPYLPGYGVFNLRLGECSNLFLDFRNIGDNHRRPSWSVDGSGRCLAARYQFRF
jgi:hypothetical protein